MIYECYVPVFSFLYLLAIIERGSEKAIYPLPSTKAVDLRLDK